MMIVGAETWKLASNRDRIKIKVTGGATEAGWGKKRLLLMVEVPFHFAKYSP
jgi:hypothetical protein